MLRRCGRRLGATLVTISLLAPAASAPAPRDTSRAEGAERLYRSAIERFAQASPDARRAALVDFQDAVDLAPGRSDIWLAFGKACLEAGRVSKARSCLARVARLTPDDFDAWYSLGDAWKGDWLASLERSSLDRAMECFQRASAAAPGRPEGWTASSALALLRGRPREALEAALRARRADEDGVEPLLMLGSALYRLSVLAYSDSAFHAARERLSGERLLRFAGVPWIDTERGAGGRAPSGTEPASWQGLDPDLTTPENEARLDYLTRLSIAWFLFRQDGEVRWDERAELFVRYGPPASIEYNSAEAQLGGKELEFHYPRHSNVWYAPDPMPYPYNMQIWRYPDLGLEVTLWDRFLAQSYELPYSNDRSLDPQPDPTLLAARPDMMAVAGGRGVFRAMAPGARPMSVAGTVSQFPDSNGVRVVAHVSAPGEPDDSLSGSWALVDAQGRAVARESRALSVSACDPTERKVAGFTATVPPGDYRLDLVARGSGGRRGVAHLRVRVEPKPAGLTMSDVVLVCGSPVVAVGSESIPFEPSVDQYLSGATTVIAYYELEGLVTGHDGSGRFDYTYSIRRAPAGRSEGAAALEGDAEGPGVEVLESRGKGRPRARRADHGRSAVLFEATREEENVGAHRRQFVTVPVASLPPSDYELRIVVRDLLSDEGVEKAVRFTKDRRGIRFQPASPGAPGARAER